MWLSNYILDQKSEFDFIISEFVILTTKFSFLFTIGLFEFNKFLVFPKHLKNESKFVRLKTAGQSIRSSYNSATIEYTVGRLMMLRRKSSIN